MMQVTVKIQAATLEDANREAQALAAALGRPLLMFSSGFVCSWPIVWATDPVLAEYLLGEAA